MADIGAFTPDQARLLWQDYLARQQLPAQQTKHYPQRPPIVETSPHRVFCKNTEAEVIPPYACMRIIGVEDVGNRTALKVEKPTSTTGHFVFNGPYEIPVDVTEIIEGETVVTEPGVGWGYRHGIVLMLGNEPATVGEQYLPIVDSWEVEAGNGPFVVFGRDQTTPQALVGRFAAGAGGGGSIMHFTIDEVDCYTGEWIVTPTHYTGGCENPPGADPYTGEYRVVPDCSSPFTEEELVQSGRGSAAYTYNLQTCELYWLEIAHCADQGC